MASILLAVGYAPVRADGLSNSVALIGDRAFVLSEARSLPTGRGVVVDVAWSEGGQCALITKSDVSMTPEVIEMAATGIKPPQFPGSLQVWNRKTNQISLVERFDMTNQFVWDAGVLPNERTCYALVVTKSPDGQESKHLRIITPGGASELVRTPSEGGDIEIGASSESSSMLVTVSSGLMQSGKVTTQMRIYNADQGRWVPVGVNLETNQLVNFVEYIPQLHAYLISVLGFGGGKPANIRYEPATGNVAYMTDSEMKQELRNAFAANPRASIEEPFQISSEEARLPDGRQTTALLLARAYQGETPETASSRPNAAPPNALSDRPLYFAVGATSFAVAPKFDGILFVQDGLAVYRDIFALSRDRIEKKVGPESQEQIMVRAKQVGLGLMMYASDNDDELPPADGLNDRVMPYIKNAEILDGFIYTYKGPPNMNSIDKPSETELGFIRGNGGSAVLYADGHVRWKPDA